MRITEDVGAASWISTRLHPFAQDVGSIIPDGFAAYARIFHPPYRLTNDGKQIPVRWRDIAAAHHRGIEAEMQRLDLSCDPTRLSPSGEAMWDRQADHGSFPLEIAVRLAQTLRAYTQTPESCWFAVWEGWGDLRLPRETVPKFSIPGRDLILLRGSIDDVSTTFSLVEWKYQSPNLWWPDDRAWCVATEIDFKWTYVGGTTLCVQQILADPDLEALPTNPAQGNTLEK